MNISTSETHETQYITEFHKFPKTEPSWLEGIRSQAMERFQVLGFPRNRRGNEFWKYTDVSALLTKNFEHEPANSAAVGSIPSGLSVINLNGAKGYLKDTARLYLAKFAPFETDPFISLNTALFQDAVLIHAAEGIKIKNPIKIHLHSNDGKVTHPRILVIAEDDSKIDISLSHFGHSSGDYFANVVSEVFVGKNASVSLFRAQREKPHSFHVANTFVSVSENGRFDYFSMDNGGGIARHNVNVSLSGQNASCNLSGVYVTRNTQHVDNHTLIHHLDSNTRSDQLYKGILLDSSRAVFVGQVEVSPGCKKVETHQTNKTLLLSPSAEINTQPVLDIATDDIQASHGNAVGQVDRDSIFYLMTRGLDFVNAQKILMEGFLLEILKSVQNESLLLESTESINKTIDEL